MDGWIKLTGNVEQAAKYVNRRNIVSVNEGDGIVAVLRNGDTVGMPELPPDEPKLPYDAEVEWLESTGTQYVDTGVIMDNTSIWSVRAKFASPGTDSFVMGQTANGVENRSAWGLHKSGAWYCGLGNKNWTGGVGDTSWHDFIVNAPADMFMVDSLSYRIGHASFSSVTSPIGFATLFARRNLSTGGIDTFCEMRVAALTITQSDTLVRNFISVRVGPLGYLYDRANPTGGPLGNGLYGDFSDGKGGVTGFPANLVGPDTNPISARSYVKDGLVAMWDGIENAGWGVHDANATTWVELVSNSSVDISGKGTFIDNALTTSSRMIGLLAARAALSAVGSSEFTVELVFSSAQFNVAIYMWGTPQGFSFITLSDYAVRLLSGGTFITQTAAGVGQSTRAYSIARSGLKAKAYINGVQSGSETTCEAIGNPTNGIDIPALQTVNNIRLYSRALTADEIAHNYAIDKERFNLP